MPTADSNSPEQTPVPPNSPAPGQLFDSEKLDTIIVAMDPVGPRVSLPPPPPPVYRKRRIKLPLILFLATLCSTFWAGANRWMPLEYLDQAWQMGSFLPVRRMVSFEWPNGLIYMFSIVSILLSHELGHFLMTVRYRIGASLPFFIPIPVISLGTMGAVIAMDGARADRKEIFDIGIAGPLAGLVFAVPLAIVGLMQLDLTIPAQGPFRYDIPFGMRLLAYFFTPQGEIPGNWVYHSQLNPFFMAGWAGFLVTGLNMLPVSQLDGGHVIYCLFGKNAKWIARGFLVFAVAYVVYGMVFIWTLMIIVVFLLGPDHPPTRDDSVQLGWPRTILGWCSLLIPVLCMPANALELFGKG